MLHTHLQLVIRRTLRVVFPRATNKRAKDAKGDVKREKKDAKKDVKRDLKH